MARPGVLQQELAWDRRWREWCWWESAFTRRLAFELAQPQLADAFTEELAESLKVVGAGVRCAVFPATEETFYVSE